MVDILIRPIVTEKMNQLTKKFNRYGFRVEKKANKHEIKKAVEEIYGVKVIAVKREKDGVPARVDSIQYDPNRTARIALLVYADGEKRYMLAPNGLQVGQTVLSGSDIAPEIGNALPLAKIPLGTIVHNIELHPGQGGIMARSAGTYAQLTSREGRYAIIKLPSGESRMILVTCRATVGTVGNSDHGLERSGKAGRSRWQGRRPRVRGVVMNPVDHPMGGGEGRASGGHPR